MPISFNSGYSENTGGGNSPSLGSAIPFLDPVVQAATDIYTTERTNKTNKQIADAANALSAQQAKEQMAFQENMSNSAYQRAMADMKQAGLNPILAYSQGGASTPSGAQGSVTTAKMERPNIRVGMADAYAKSQAVSQANETRKLTVQQTSATAAQAMKANTEAQKVAYDAERSRNALAAEMPEAKARAFRAKTQNEFDQKYRDLELGSNLIRNGLSTANEAKDLVNPLGILGKMLRGSKSRMGNTSAYSQEKPIPSFNPASNDQITEAFKGLY